MSERLHPAAWTAWTAATGALILTLSNPALIVVAIAALSFVAVAMAPDRGPFALMIKLGVFALIVRTILFALTGHPAGEILFTMPQIRLPALMGGFTLGGPIAAPVVAHSAIEGLRLLALLACAGVFLSVVDATRIVRLMPRFLFEAGLIVAIGVAFVPNLVRTARDVRDAQRIRGERIRGFRSLGLAMPILATTLERAVTVAESMEARGYGRSRTPEHRREAGARVAALGGIALLTGGAILATVARAWIGGLFAAAGAGVLAWAIGRLSALSLRTRYRRDRIRAHDTATIAVALATAVAAVVRRGAWSYDAYPFVVAPVVPVAGVLVVALIAAPVAVVRIRARRLRLASVAPQAAA